MPWITTTKKSNSARDTSIESIEEYEYRHTIEAIATPQENATWDSYAQTRKTPHVAIQVLNYYDQPSSASDITFLYFNAQLKQNNELLILLNKMLGSRRMMSEHPNKEIGFYCNRSDLKNIDSLGIFFTKLVEFDPNLNEIIDELFNRIGYTPKTFKEKKYEDEITKFIEGNKITEAFSYAKDKRDEGYFSPTWRLAEYLFQNLETDKPNVDAQEAFELYQSIPDDNPHFIEANKKLLEFIYRQVIPIDESQKFELLEDAFRIALRSKDQERIDQLYQEISGKKGTPTLRNIKGDEEMLIALARERRETQQLVNKLNREIDSLRNPTPTSSGPGMGSVNNLV